jgi:dienelactone hydrolase
MNGNGITIFKTSKKIMKSIIGCILGLLILPFISSAQIETISKDVSFITKDSITISATFEIPKVENKKHPALILIHQGGSTREEWKALQLWNDLLAEGYAILAYDVRIHGTSETDEGDIYNLFDNPYRAPLDLLAAIDFLEKEQNIDSNRIGIIGASIGANLACVASASEKYNIKSAVSMSSKTKAVQSLSGSNEKLTLKNVFHIASKQEQNGMRATWANELFSKTTGYKEVVIANGNKHGSFILREKKILQTRIIEWFKKTL